MPYWDSPTIRFDPESVKNFNQTMLRYAGSLDKVLATTLHQWAGRLAEEFERESPPFVDKGASNTIEAKRRGERAAKEALMKSVTPATMIFKDDFKSKSLKTIVRRKQYEKFNAIKKNFPKLKSWEAKPFTPDLHLKNRPRGRYDYLKRNKVLTFDLQKFKQYERQLIKKVGYLKAGWAVAAEALGKKVPEWIRRHLPYAKGKIRMQLDGPDKFILFENFTPTIARFSGRYNYAMDWIAKRMTKQMEFILKAESDKIKNN